MTREVICVAPDEELSAATRLMLSKRVNALPVVERVASGAPPRLVGLLSRKDVLAALVSSPFDGMPV